MRQYKKDFIEFMVRSAVLTFGDFVTKSGRRTPFFINTGNYRTGEQMRRLGRFYADAVEANFGGGFDVLFGPAYKGIPLVVSTATALAERGRDVAFCFNRKEAKDHGEGGMLVGHKLRDGERVVIVEDVTTAGTSIREVVPLIRDGASVTQAGLIVSVDRQEKGPDGRNALESLRDEFGMPTAAIVTLEEVVTYLCCREIDGRVLVDEKTMERIESYRAKYGASPRG
ncbi:MAG: orotate phosphoribosyltransferase [Chitinivibrionales bacterium]|nr:orotate phosphoribosyltransferase [Chitinivibrionales bacterium]MBD3356620.1 orotate phosphoribosyltransferase [Chitinivibrionales bacterium]